MVQLEANPALNLLLSEIRSCRICRDSPAGTPLPHEPRPVLQGQSAARILIAGQAPGIRVHASGRPFTDPSGVRLRQWLGLDEEQFYDASRVAILPMGFCFPGLTPAGADLPPRPECARAWRSLVLGLLPNVGLVICLGAHAQRWHLGPAYKGSLDATVRNWREGAGLSPPVFALPHPSWRNSGWLKRNPWFESDLLPPFRARVAELL